MFFENFKTTADKLPDDLRLKFYDALTDYVFKGIEPDDAIISALVTAFKPSLDKVETRGGAREGAGRPKNDFDNIDNQKNQNNSKIIKDNQKNQSFLETETETENIPPKIPNGILSPKGENTPLKKFIKPKIEEIISYCRERNNSVNPERFFDFYESKGWKVGKNPMKDWRAAVRTWEREDKARGGSNTEEMVTIDESLKIDETMQEFKDMTFDDCCRAYDWLQGKMYLQVIARPKFVELVRKFKGA